MRETNEWANHAGPEKIAVFMQYIADGLDVPIPPDATIRVYMDQLKLLEGCLEELTSRILRTYKYKSFPPIEFIHSTQQSLPANRRLRRLQMLQAKIHDVLYNSRMIQLDKRNPHLPSSREEGAKKINKIIKSMTPDHSAPPRPE